jgi:hypothetical protein
MSPRRLMRFSDLHLDFRNYESTESLLQTTPKEAMDPNCLAAKI